MKLSLRTKILLLIAGTTSGLAAVVFAALGALTETGIDRAVRDDVRATGGVLTQLIRERTSTLTGECRILADLPVLKAVAETGDPATINDTARDSLKQIDADAVMITDRNGAALAVTDGGVPVRADVRNSPGVDAALTGQEWSGIVTRRDRLVLAVCTPIRMGPEVWGTLSAYRRIDTRVALRLKTDLGTDVAFVVDGNVVGSSVDIPSTLAVRPDIPALVDIGPDRYLALYSPLREASGPDRIGYITLRRYDTAVAPYRNLRIAFLMLFGLTLALSMTAGLIIARGLVNPLDGLIRAAHTLSTGTWPERFDVRRTDEIGLLQSVFNDMTEAIRDSRERLLGLIDIDPLTGFINHRRFQERLAEESKRCGASGEPLTLMRINIDRFQEYNQTYGHAAGDRALEGIAAVVKSRVPELAVISRFGGDEIAALLPQQTAVDALVVAESIRTAVASGLDAAQASPSAMVVSPSLAPLSLEGRGAGGEGFATTEQSAASGLTVSIGIAEFGTHSKQHDGLVLAAELAVSRAKSLGRNMVCGFDSVPGADETADPYQLHRFLKDESLATIQALAAAVDAKDSYTQGHSQSVAGYATDLARYLGQGTAAIQLIHTAGTLHDVGKIGVPDSILKKPGRLDDEERRIMETHPVLGELIVRKVPSLSGILPGVRHHHERWDGRGYPDRLTGGNIPEIARILALADSFDAMTSDRPYRKGMPMETALAEIERGAGTQFDPDLAHAFLEMIRTRDLRRVA